jgi:hypothetical protein
VLTGGKTEKTGKTSNPSGIRKEFQHEKDRKSANFLRILPRISPYIFQKIS